MSAPLAPLAHGPERAARVAATLAALISLYLALHVLGRDALLAAAYGGLTLASATRAIGGPGPGALSTIRNVAVVASLLALGLLLMRELRS